MWADINVITPYFAVSPRIDNLVSKYIYNGYFLLSTKIIINLTEVDEKQETQYMKQTAERVVSASK